MTTQTERMQVNQPIQTQVKTSHWLWALAAVLVLILAGGATRIYSSSGEVQASSRHGLDAISARYQAMANAYAIGNLLPTSQALTVISDRYQGMLEIHTTGQRSETLSALTAISERYQGQADSLSSEIDRGFNALKILSSRYQAQADLLARGPMTESLRALTILSNRYQALADR